MANSISSRAVACSMLHFPNATANVFSIPARLQRAHQSSYRELAMSSNAALAASVVPVTMGSGGAVLDRPDVDVFQFEPLVQVQEGGDPGRLRNRKGTGSGDSYKVLLVDDPRHTEEQVEKALPQVVPSITPEEARKLFHESRQKGVAVVIRAVKEHAEFYAQMMVQKGLRSAIEPDGELAS